LVFSLHLENKRALHLDGLNGIRAIAAIAVVISHVTQHLANFNLDPYIFGKMPDGSPRGLLLAGGGVSMFFSLSGFLITYLLLLEKAERNKVNIRFFYIRRILRIWPLYYLFIGICLITMHFSGDKVNPGTLLFYIFYAPNIPFVLGTSIPVLAHYWSLGVEEQFYLFWPWVVAKTKKKLEWVVFFGIVFLITLKLIARYLCPGHDNSFFYQFIHVTRFHCMLIGALGAIFFVKKNTLFIKICTHKISQLVAWGVLAALALNQFHIASVIDGELLSAITVVIILGQATKVNRLVNLQTKIPDFFGKISYGIYVYHPLIIWLISLVFVNIKIEGMFKYLVIYSATIAATIGIAYLSYSYFEKWFLKMKLNYAIIKGSEV
jgi:peptidoglycan/LPS O-acetylase OafA/YrhL